MAPFEASFFNSMVRVLDALSVRRSQNLETKDDPLNEVPVLCGSITENDGRVCVDKPISLDPARPVLKLEVGDPISLTPSDFAPPSDACFADLQRRDA